MKKSIKFKILVNVLVLVVVGLLLVGGVSAILSYSSTQSLLKQNMQEVAKVAAERVEWEVQAYNVLAYELGSTSRLSDDNVSIKDKQEIVQQKLDKYGMVAGDLIGLDGISVFNGNDYSSEEYFVGALKGRT